MHKQPNLNPTMRSILVDWIVEVHMKFRLTPETLYLAVNLLDRYLFRVEVRRSKLQLVGVTALLIACKYEEIYPPEVRDCVYITNRAYTRQEVLDMELEILEKLRYKVAVPTAHPFLQRFLHILKASTMARHASHYYMERVLQEYEFLVFRPSIVAAASVCLALNHPDICDYDGVTEHPGVVSAWRRLLFVAVALMVPKAGGAARIHGVLENSNHEHRQIDCGESDGGSCDGLQARAHNGQTQIRRSAVLLGFDFN